MVQDTACRRAASPTRRAARWMHPRVENAARRVALQATRMPVAVLSTGSRSAALLYRGLARVSAALRRITPEPFPHSTRHAGTRQLHVAPPQIEKKKTVAGLASLLIHTSRHAAPQETPCPTTHTHDVWRSALDESGGRHAGKLAYTRAHTGTRTSTSTDKHAHRHSS